MKPAVKYGLGLGLAQIIFSLILYFTNQMDTTFGKGVGLLNYVIMVLAAIMAMRERRELQGGTLSYGQGLGTGLATITLGGAISSLFTYIYLKFLDREMLMNMKDVAEQQLEKSLSSAPESARESAFKFLEISTRPGFLFLMGILGSVIVGLIISLVLAAILKRDTPPGPPEPYIPESL